MKNRTKKAAFTLAEVLITLGVIGIVASMTIPTLMADNQKLQALTKLEKSFSTIQQTIKLLLVTEGVSNFGDTSLFNGAVFSNATRQSIIDDTIKRSLKVANSCLYGDTSCYVQENYLGSTVFVADGGTQYNFCLLDGVCYQLVLPTACEADNTKIGKIKALCGEIALDINGKKAPNQYGKDFFNHFVISQDGTLYPKFGIEYAKFTDGAGWATADSYWKNHPTHCGATETEKISYYENGAKGECLARIMESGWQISYY